MKQGRQSRGYTLVETLVAGGLLALAISAAASLSLTMVSQEEVNLRNARALNLLENSAQLYRLGVEPDRIAGLLPNDSIVVSLQFAAGVTTVSGGVGDLDYADISLRYRTSAPGESPVSERTETLRAYRQTIPRKIP